MQRMICSNLKPLTEIPTVLSVAFASVLNATFIQKWHFCEYGNIEYDMGLYRDNGKEMEATI